MNAHYQNNYKSLSYIFNRIDSVYENVFNGQNQSLNQSYENKVGKTIINF